MRSPSIRMPTLAWTCCERPSTRRPALMSTCGGAWASSGPAAHARTANESARTKSPKESGVRLPGRQRFTVRVEESDLSKIQLPNPRLDLGPVAHHHPHEVIGPDRLLRRAACIRNRQRPDPLGIGVEVPVLETVRDDLLER